VDWSALTPLSVSLLMSKLRFSTYIFIILYSTPSGFEKVHVSPSINIFQCKKFGKSNYELPIWYCDKDCFFKFFLLENILK
jgi:hypothetical protein